MAYDGNFTLAHRHGDDPRGCPDHSGSLHTWKRLLKTVVGFSGVWASCAIASILALTTTLPWFQALCLPACLCLLALCWHPKVRHHANRRATTSLLSVVSYHVRTVSVNDIPVTYVTSLIMLMSPAKGKSDPDVANIFTVVPCYSISL